MRSRWSIRFVASYQRQMCSSLFIDRYRYWQGNGGCIVHSEDVARKVHEKDICICVFVDLEKAFDRVLRTVIEWALRKHGVQ